jgi:hypothetical protein
LNLSSLIPAIKERPEIEAVMEGINGEEDDGWSMLDRDYFPTYGRSANDSCHDRENEVVRKDMTGV